MAVACSLTLLAACVSVPQGPTVAVMPGTGKTVEQFSTDGGACQQYAHSAISGPTQNAQGSAATSAVGGAALGAAVGALLGAATGQAGAGAAWGAGTGLFLGGAAAGNAGMASSYNLQRQYDAIYLQCMASRGNQVPGRVVRRAAPPNVPPSGRFAVPPNALTPPPGTPPPQGLPYPG